MTSAARRDTRAQQRAQRGVRLARHRGGMGAAAAHLHGVVGGEAGGAEEVAGVSIHGDDAQGKPGLEVIVEVQCHDGVHRALGPIARRSGVPATDGGSMPQSSSEDRATVGGEGVGIGGVGMHGSLVPVGKPEEVGILELGSHAMSAVVTDTMDERCPMECRLKGIAQQRNQPRCALLDLGKV